MTAPRLATLLERAHAGEATAADAFEATKLLRLASSPGDRYDALFVIGKSNATAYRSIVEEYLDASEEPMLARLALQILADWWGPPNQYRDQIARFVDGVDWDLHDGSYVRLIAMSAAGELLRNHDDPGLLRGLLAVFDDADLPDLVREQSYSAIARAEGRSWAEIPGLGKPGWLDRVDVSIVAKARRHAAD